MTARIRPDVVEQIVAEAVAELRSPVDDPRLAEPRRKLEQLQETADQTASGFDIEAVAKLRAAVAKAWAAGEPEEIQAAEEALLRGSGGLEMARERLRGLGGAILVAEAELEDAFAAAAEEVGAAWWDARARLDERVLDLERSHAEVLAAIGELEHRRFRTFSRSAVGLGRRGQWHTILRELDRLEVK
ncbi:MAG TPA: hypothetical protein PKJ99_12210 [Thermoanaerobaculales bacterium]|nr:hypothetical protein [Thermoanaerobaculales bacterium]HQL30859.1 hypothetical protein [Thermoanaerobaculales bacterium]